MDLILASGKTQISFLFRLVSRVNDKNAFSGPDRKFTVRPVSQRLCAVPGPRCLLFLYARAVPTGAQAI